MSLGPNAWMIGAPGSRAALVTPALILDRAAYARNLAQMAEIAKARGVHLRPHAKTHKCVEIARAQVASGAIGVSCTVLREADVMVSAGIASVLVTSPVVTPNAIRWLIDIARMAGPGGLMIVVDDRGNARALSDAAQAMGYPLDVLVDFGAGYERTGTSTEDGAVDLARAIGQLPGLRLRGLQAYAGNIQHIQNREERSGRAAELRAKIARILAGAAKEGIVFSIVTGGGTGTHDLDQAPFTEIQPGSYLFLDAQYAPVLADGVGRPPFETALFIQSTVIGVYPKDYVILDAGVKSMATDGPLPLVSRGVGGDATYAFFGDEYGKLFCSAPRPTIGAKIELVTPHCDPTVNLYDVIHVVEGETLVDIWPIAARGH